MLKDESGKLIVMIGILKKIISCRLVPLITILSCYLNRENQIVKMANNLKILLCRLIWKALNKVGKIVKSVLTALI